MNSYPESVYGWNHYDGDSPQMSGTGLPLELAAVDLPTSIPESSGMSTDDTARTDQLPYSPGLLEMGSSNVPDATGGAAVQTSQGTQPSLWQTVSKAVLSGKLAMSSTNSAANVASGVNTTINTSASAT